MNDQCKNNLTNEQNEGVFIQHLLKYLPYYIFWKDATSTYLGCNENFAKLAGVNDINSITGLTDFDLNWGEGEAEDFQQADQKVMRGVKQVNREEILARPDGSKITMLVSKTPVYDHQQRIIGILGISTDISRIKEAEIQLKEAKEKADIASKATLVFAHSMAHELRTPLASVNGYFYGIKKYLPALLEGYKLAKENNLPVSKIKKEHYKSFKNILKNSEVEIKHANSVIDMTLFRANPNKYKKTAFKICSISSCIKKSLERFIFKKNYGLTLINCKIEMDFKLKGEKLLVMHIIFNLLKNALFYIEKERKGEIYIWTSTEVDLNLLHFKDTSKGINAAALPKIFDLYFSETPHGTGVGLAFCKQVMEIFSGSIECRSEEGKYTEFILRFPKLKTKNKLQTKKQTTRK